jgi:hypothetical protein
MGLRSPQELVKSGTRALPGTNLQGGVAQMDNRFIQSAANSINEIRQQDAKQVQFLKDSLEVENENDRIQTQAELAKLEGVNALDQGPKLRERLKKNAEERLSKVPEKYRPYLQNIPGETVNKFSAFAYPYEAQQSKKLTADVLKQRTAARVNEAVENSNDDVKFNDTLKLVADDATRMAYTQYGEDMNRDVGNGVTVGEVVKQYQKNAVSDTVSRAIQAQLSVGRMDIAEKIRASYGKELTGADQSKVGKAIQSAVRRGETKVASTLAEQARLAHPDNTAQQEDFIIANSANNAIAKEAIQFNNLEQAQIKAQEDKQQKELLNSLSKKAGKVPVSQLMQEAADLPLEKKSRLLGYAKSLVEGSTISTDYARLNLLKDKFKTMSPDEIRGYDFSEDRLYINPRDLSPWESLQRSALNKDRNEADKARYATDKAFNDIRDDFLVKYSRELPGKDNTEKVGSMIESIKENILDQQPRITLPELRKQIKKELYDRGVKPSSFSVLKPATWFNDYELNESLAKPAQAETADDIHPSWIEAARASLKPGVTKSDDEIKTILKARVKADLTKPKAR